MASYPTGNNPHVTEEQRIYAAWLDKGWKVGFVMMVVLFALYLSGVVTPHIPLAELPNYWALSAEKYREANQIHNGWWWATMLHRGDFLNFVGIAFLSGVTSLCFLRIIPLFIRNKEPVYLTIAILESLVLLLAASGILAVGH